MGKILIIFLITFPIFTLSTVWGSKNQGKDLLLNKEEKLEAQERRRYLKNNSENKVIVFSQKIRRLKSGNLNFLRVPAFITLDSKQPLGKIVGPLSAVDDGFSNYSDVYIRWFSGIYPSPGEHFDIFVPQVVLQDRNDNSSFKIRVNRFGVRDRSQGYNLAGYVYESKGFIEIMGSSKGLVKARIRTIYGKIEIGDFVIAKFPSYKNIKSIHSPVRLFAVIVAGIPLDRISPTAGSFVHINRGSRDGVEQGALFRMVAPIYVWDSEEAIPQKNILGEVMVTHVSEAYSTAIITRQFSTIQLGSLLETTTGDYVDTIVKKPVVEEEPEISEPPPPPPKVEIVEDPPPKVEIAKEPLPLKDIGDNDELAAFQYEDELEERERLKQDALARANSYRYRLDRLEASVGVLDITDKEQKRLAKLHRQELKQGNPISLPLEPSEDWNGNGEDGAGTEEVDLLEQEKESDESSAVPPVEYNSFQKKKKKKDSRRKRAQDKRKPLRDEEQLNSLFDNK